jgi:hypothetical protein
MIRPPAHDPNREIRQMYDFRQPKYLLGDPTENCPRASLAGCIELENPPPEIQAVHDQFSHLQSLLRSEIYIRRGGDDVANDTKIGREFELKLWWFLKNECRLNVTPPDLTLFVTGSDFAPKEIIDENGRKIEGLMEEEARRLISEKINGPVHEEIKIDVVRSPHAAWMGDLTVLMDELPIAVHCKTTSDDTIDRTYGRPSLTVGRGARSKGADPHILRFPSDEILAFGIKKKDGRMLLAYFSHWQTAATVPTVPVQDSLLGEKVCFYLDDLVALDPSSYPPSPSQIRAQLNSIYREIEKTKEKTVEAEQDRIKNLQDRLEDASEDQRKQILRELKFASSDPVLDGILCPTK